MMTTVPFSIMQLPWKNSLISSGFSASFEIASLAHTHVLSNILSHTAEPHFRIEVQFSHMPSVSLSSSVPIRTQRCIILLYPSEAIFQHKEIAFFIFFS